MAESTAVATRSRGPVEGAGSGAPSTPVLNKDGKRRLFRVTVRDLNSWAFNGKIYKRGSHVTDDINVAKAAARCRFGVVVEGLHREERKEAQPLPEFEDPDDQIFDEGSEMDQELSE